MAKKFNEISISDPVTGNVETFQTIREARTAAKHKSYSPVFINLYDEMGIIEDIAVINKSIGAMLGSMKSKKKAQAARENGKKGGRPKNK